MLSKILNFSIKKFEFKNRKKKKIHQFIHFQNKIIETKNNNNTTKTKLKTFTMILEVKLMTEVFL